MEFTSKDIINVVMALISKNIVSLEDDIMDIVKDGNCLEVNIDNGKSAYKIYDSYNNLYQIFIGTEFIELIYNISNSLPIEYDSLINIPENREAEIGNQYFIDYTLSFIKKEEFTLQNVNNLRLSFISALSFCLLHEIGHLKYDKIITDPYEREYNADKYAYDKLKEIETNNTEYSNAINIGILLSFYCICMVENKSYTLPTHPFTEDRYKKIYQNLKISEKSDIFKIYRILIEK